MASKKKKRGTLEDAEAEGSPQKKSKPLPESKFGGMTEEEVCKLLLPDHMKANLDIIFVRACRASMGSLTSCSSITFAVSHIRLASIQASTLPISATTTATPTTTFVSRGSGGLLSEIQMLCFSFCYAGPCLYESGLIPKKLTYREDAELLNYGIGITNIVPRTTRAANELSRYVGVAYCVCACLCSGTSDKGHPNSHFTRKEMREWSAVMIERMKDLKPLVACFNGKGIYEIFSGGKCEVGVQAQPLPGTDTVRR